ncbi:MAG: hypothetical protein ACR2H5_09645 [Ktedonobacteraceae bacterium]
MNISTGGPHILLFERDQQLVALLNSELQLAGYEIHTARTAVEVFDAIARYPVRLVLVNLAQAAAARREFWVALDTQRRGRGVQVLSFHCTNIAGYGPTLEEPDERAHTVQADMEVDGMLGLMNMVNAIRSRIAVSNTGAMSRLTASAHTQTPTGTQATMPVPAVQRTPNNPSPVGSSTTSTLSTPPQPTVSSPSSPLEAARTSNPHQTDKIRAVIYPNQRTWSATRDSSSGNSQFPPTREQPSQEIPWSARTAQIASNSTPSATPDAINATPASAPNPYRTSQGQDTRPTNEGGLPKESGLAQLSRMLQEQHPPTGENISQESPATPSYLFQAESSMQQAVRPNNAPTISTIAMRASPIQDMPTDRINAGQSDTSNRRSDESTYPKNAHTTNAQTSSPSPTLMSIAASVAPIPLSPSPMPPTPLSPVLPPTFQPATPPAQVTAPSPLPSTPENTTPPMPVEGVNVPFYIEPEPPTEESENDAPASNGSTGNTLAEQIQAVVKANTTLPEPTQKTPDTALLLDIVQSLPPMPTPPPQSAQPPQVHQGRATRSLGSVLLEGHLVPQNRLEVALNIQRMLRSVDMNYQLGEILLMFKLLTPDQLLAASLVSYGLITPAQISALGRIRQELHSIGLEYDLENLLILFRILTSEQLREVRASWVG